VVEKRTVLPLEIKSGKPRTNHTAQVLLYELLLSDRYNDEVRAGTHAGLLVLVLVLVFFFWFFFVCF
jgi:hypothetical protein